VNAVPVPAGVHRSRRDLGAAAGGALVYSFALGIASVALPLIALAAGYSAFAVGVLTACSAVTQMLARTGLGRLMRVVPDRVLVIGASALLAMSTAVLAISTERVPFVLAELLQGVSRACFWTGSQTHVVRRRGSSLAALSTVNFVSSIGLLAGPAVAGLLLEHGQLVTLVVATVAAVLAMPISLLLDRLPPFTVPPDRPPGRLWRRKGMDTGVWAGMTAGAWRGLLGSYVPAALERAGQSPTTVGALVSVANAAQIVGSAVVRWVQARNTHIVFGASMLATGIATGTTAAVAGSVPLAVAALGVSGIGAGVLQVIGPASATDAVHPEERGEAIAVTGTFRAGALLAAPLGVAGLILVMPLAGAMALVGIVMAAPVLLVRNAVPPPTTHEEAT